MLLSIKYDYFIRAYLKKICSFKFIHFISRINIELLLLFILSGIENIYLPFHPCIPVSPDFILIYTNLLIYIALASVADINY